MNYGIFPAGQLKTDGYFPEEEILSVLSVPPGKMGRVIGKRGSTILAIKQSCEYALILFHFLYKISHLRL